MFDDLTFDAQLIRDRLEVRTWLHKGLKIIFKDRGAETTEVLEHPGGVADYLAAVVKKDEATAVSEPFVLAREELPSYELALCWTDAQR